MNFENEMKLVIENEQFPQGYHMDRLIFLRIHG